MITERDTSTIHLDAAPSGHQCPYLHHPPIFKRNVYKKNMANEWCIAANISHLQVPFLSQLVPCAHTVHTNSPVSWYRWRGLVPGQVRRSMQVRSTPRQRHTCSDCSSPAQTTHNYPLLTYQRRTCSDCSSPAQTTHNYPLLTYQRRTCSDCSGPAQTTHNYPLLTYSLTTCQAIQASLEFRVRTHTEM